MGTTKLRKLACLSVVRTAIQNEFDGWAECWWQSGLDTHDQIWLQAI